MIPSDNLKTWQCKREDGTWVPCAFGQIEEGDTIRIFHDGVLQKGPKGETEYKVVQRPCLTGDWVTT